MTSVNFDTPTEPDAAQPAARYRAVSRAAVGSLALAVLSPIVFLSWWFAVAPAAAIFLGWRALLHIDRSKEDLTGRSMALVGMGLALVAWTGGYAWLALARAREVPSGYQRVEYSELQPDPEKPDEWIPASATALNDKKIYVKGYMMPSRQQIRLGGFILCPTNGVCKFCNPNPTRTEMILVTLSGDLVTDYTTHLLGIGGRFHVDPQSPTGIPYSMEVDYLY
jgi:hypothetical protein